MDATLPLTNLEQWLTVRSRKVCFDIVFGLKVFMDAHGLSRRKSGDRYPLRPPEFCVGVMVAQEVRDTEMWGRHHDARSGSIPQRNLSFASVSMRKSLYKASSNSQVK